MKEDRFVVNGGRTFILSGAPLGIFPEFPPNHNSPTLQCRLCMIRKEVAQKQEISISRYDVIM